MTILSMGESSSNSRPGPLDSKTRTPAWLILLEEVRGLELLAAEPILVVEDEGVERRPRLQGGQQGHEPRAALELGPGHLVRVNVLFGDGPALLCGVGAGEVDLASDRLFPSATPFCSSDFLA